MVLVGVVVVVDVFVAGLTLRLWHYHCHCKFADLPLAAIVVVVVAAEGPSRYLALVALRTHSSETVPRNGIQHFGGASGWLVGQTAR